MVEVAPAMVQPRQWGRLISEICRISVIGLFQVAPIEGAYEGVLFAGDGTKPLLDSFGEPYYAPGGHHEMPQSIFGKWDLPEETRRVFDQATTGPLQNGRTNVDGAMKGHFWDRGHREYNEAVSELSERFVQDRGIEINRMTPEQAGDLLKEIRETEDPRIRNYNRTMRMIRRIFRGGRE